MTDTLHTKYRPTKFADVIGQEHFMRKLVRLVKDRASHAFLFHGPAGCGKTTLARICAAELGCTPGSADLVEHDGATKNGVEDMRMLQESIRYKPLGAGKYRSIILDEVHRVSGQAFDSILKIVEEPPSHLFWFFCTTNPSKVPTTIRSRCQQFSVREVQPDVLMQLLTDVCKQEGIRVPADVLAYISGKSLGSPRRALINLEGCLEARTKKEAAKLLEQVVDEDTILELCRFIARYDKKRTWTKAMELVEKLGEAQPEGIRIIVANYLASCAEGARSDQDAVQYLSMLEAFSTPYAQGEAKPGLMLSLGKALLAE